jgi:putative ABC transport system permease protein
MRTRTAAGGLGHARTRNALVVVQLALSLALLAGAGLLARSLIALSSVNPGFEVKNILSAQFRLPAAKYDTPEKIWNMFERTIAEIRAVPGVESAALVRASPLSGNGESYAITIEGQPPVTPGSEPQMQINSITTDYFSTMRIPRLAGRDISEADRAGTLPVIVVNEEFAKRTWPGQSPIGKRVKFSEQWWTIVGVVGTAKHRALSERPLLQGYVAHAQRPQIFTSLVVRTAGDPLKMGAAVRNAIWRVDADQPIWRFRSMEQDIESAVASPRVTVMLTLAFAAIALILAAIGIYGVLSYTMAQRTHELGVRMALGAQDRQVVRMVIVEGMRVVFVAIAVGLVAALALARVLQTQLFGVGPSDPVTYLVVTALLAIVAAFACYVPARRASRVDPVVALRSE